jgi:hypothetical protein
MPKLIVSPLVAADEEVLEGVPPHAEEVCRRTQSQDREVCGGTRKGVPPHAGKIPECVRRHANPSRRNPGAQATKQMCRRTQ